MSHPPPDRAYPLTSHGDPAAVIAWRRQGAVSVARFLADVHHLADCLPAGGHLLNICQDRYRFMVGLAAGLLAGKISLQPSSHTPETVRQLLQFAPDTICLHDAADGDGQPPFAGLPCLRFPEMPEMGGGTGASSGEETSLASTLPMPMIPGEQIAAYVFTSGSTGSPVPHAKTWGGLVRNAQAGAELLGTDRCGHAIVGTVPGQHMYGFESTVLLALHGNCAAWSGRPFYPADITGALAAVPQPRLLVTTPVHLRTLLDSGIELPPVGQLLSATAPLSEALAREAEKRFAAPLNEIYGCTETGQIASRRTTASPQWRLLRDVMLTQEIRDGQTVTLACGGHVEGCVSLSDVIELLDSPHFLLHGRNADLINIAGKRTSLAYLNHQLTAIDGVADGAFFMPDEETPDGITRLAAFVVAPTLSARELHAALRQRIDPIFLPRPLVQLEQMPRNATGKLPRSALQALFTARREAS